MTTTIAAWYSLVNMEELQTAVHEMTEWAAKNGIHPSTIYLPTPTSFMLDKHSLTDNSHVYNLSVALDKVSQ